MRSSPSPLTRILFTLLAFHLVATAQAQNWTNTAGDNLWSTLGNWDVDPAGGTAVVNLDGDQRAIIDDGTVVVVNTVRVGQGSGTVGELVVTGGSFDASLSGGKNRFGTSGGSGTLNMSGGSFLLGGNQTQFGLDAGSVGILNLSGGTFIGYREFGGYSIFIGDNGYGEVNISGGSLLTRAGVRVGNGIGLGVFSVSGSSITEIGIGAHGTIAGAWNQIADSILKLRIDAGGITPIDIDNSGANNGFFGEIVFADGALLDVDFIGEAQTGTWVVMQWDEGVTVTDNGLGFVEGTPLYQWSFEIDEINRQLTVTKTNDPAPSNQAPVAQDDAGGVGHGREMPIKVMANDSDPDGDPISIVSVGGDPLGSAVIDGEWIVYTAPANYKGTDTFTYTISDGELTATASVSMDIGRFNHPGILHKQSDLERMKAMVQAGKDPWYSSFLLMLDDPHSHYDWLVLKNPEDNTLARENPCHECGAYREDARAAYLNALMWFLTEDERHAEKAIEIINAWSSLTNFYGGGTEPLSAGLFGSPLINAAEIIRYTYDGWAAEDIKKFEDMLVFPGYSNIEKPPGVGQLYPEGDNVTFYWRTYMGDAGRFGNQGLLAWRTVMAIGIFLDNPIIYDRAVRYITGQPHRPDDFPYTSGPPIVSTTPNASSYEQQLDFTRSGVSSEIEDYGYDDQIQWYIRETGQSQELSRDQGHAVLGISTAGELSEMAWNQGDDVYGYLDNRVLKGLEYALRYNVSLNYSYPDQPTPWEPTVESGEFFELKSRSGRWISLAINPYVSSDKTRYTRGTLNQPTAELPLAHYKTRAKLDPENYKWLERWRDNSILERGLEQSGFRLDQPGWGGLTYRRPIDAAGDPIVGIVEGMPVFSLPVFPGTIGAANYDAYPIEGEGFTYSDTTPENSGGAYREDGVDIDYNNRQGNYLTAMADGEWVAYTVNVPQAGLYSITVRCATAGDSGTLEFIFNGDNSTGPLAVPDTSGANSWRDQILIDSFELESGVQTMRLLVGGTADTINLASISLEATFGQPFDVQAIPFFSGIVDLDWAATPMAVSYNVKRSTTAGGPYETIASGLTETHYTDAGREAGVDYYYVVTAFDGTTESSPSVEAIANTATVQAENYTAVVLADDPVAYFRFEETEGPTLTSNGIIAVSMTAYNDPLLDLPGLVGSGIEFPVTAESYAESIHRTAFGEAGSFTLSFWINPDPVAPGSPLQAIIGKGDEAFQILRDTSDHTLLFSVANDASGVVTLQTQNAVPSGQWTHVAAVFDQVTGTLSLYLNGTQDAQSATLTGDLPGSANRILLVGARNDENTLQKDFYEGKLDELAIYGSALGSETIALLARIGGLFAPPQLNARIEIDADGVTSLILPRSLPGRRFQIQSTDTLDTGTWFDLGDEVLGDGTDLHVILDLPVEPTRNWYRIFVRP